MEFKSSHKARFSGEDLEVLKYLLEEEGIEQAQPSAITPRNRQGNPPLSFGQERLWVLAQFEPDSPTYTIPFALRLVGPLDVAAFQRSLSEIVRRHEVLRTTFPMMGGRPVQSIASPLIVPLSRVDLHDLPPAEREVLTLQLAHEEARFCFDLARGPLLRMTLLRVDAVSHVFLLVIHHIICDGWSIGVFMRELAALYDAFSSGQPSRLPELTIQYADFAYWQRQALQGVALEEQVAYWRDQLGDAPAMLALPTDRPRPSVYTSCGATYSFTLPPQLTTSLQTLSQRAGATLFMTLLAAFQTLLGRYSQQTDLVVGTPIANRTRSEIASLIGCFINTLVLRTDLSGNPDFRELLARVRRVCLDAYAHQDLPFEQLVEALQPERDLSRNPLFQVIFVLQNALMEDLALPGLELQRLAIDNRTAKLDMTLTLEEVEQGLAGTVEYNTALFDSSTIARMVGHFQMLLAGIVAQPDRPIATLLLLTDAEWRQVLLEWNATTALYPQDQCLHQLVATQAARTPDSVAVAFDRPTTNDQRPKIEDGRSKIEDRRSPAFHPRSSVLDPRPSVLSPQSSVLSPEHLTYRELNARANRLAHHLVSLGVGPEVVVAVCMERSIELVIALLGVPKAGGAYLPLDPTYPTERIAFMLEDSRAAVLITATNDQRPTTNDGSETRRQGDKEIIKLFVSLSPGLRVSRTVVDLRADWPAIVRAPDHDPAAPVVPDHQAYAIYTSGSTGTPKGAMNSHRGIVNRLLWMQAAYCLRADDRVLQKTPISFDVSVWEFFWPLLNGARLILARPGGQQDPTYLAQLIVREQITTLHFVPPMLQVFLEVPELAGCSSLRQVICSGEALPLEVQQRFFARLSADLYNLYGPTEAAIDVTAWACTRETEQRSVPIGRPIANTQIYLLDRHMRPVPAGMSGELYIGGVGLARGYLYRPDLTAERFVPNPFAGVMGDGCWVLEDAAPVTQHPSPITRLYRTGDLARYRPDGAIEFLGRTDHQVKIRGNRVELGEIEAVLRQHQAVREAVVVCADAPGNKRLVAYIVTSDKSQVTSTEDSSLVTRHSSLGSELRAFLKEHVPDYMAPAEFVLMTALPLTQNGKIDRAALPAPERVRPELDQAFVAPRTAEEHLLAAIWSSVLGIETIGVHDNFFALGGDSIRSIQIVSQAREHDLHFSLQQFFQHQTIYELLQGLRAAQRRAAPARQQRPFSLLSEADRANVPDGLQDAYPMTMLQLGMYFHSKYAPELALYQNVSSIHLRAPFDRRSWEIALRDLLARHPVLRTSFDFISFGTPLQLVHSTADVPLQIDDLQQLAPAAQEAVIRDWQETERWRAFDWSRPPLIRFHLHRRAPDSFQLGITEHHAILDGWSVATMMTELMTDYIALVRGAPRPEWAVPATAFRDFVALEQAVLESPEQQRYWAEKLRGCHIRAQPTRDLALLADAPQIHCLPVPIVPALAEDIKRLARLAAVPIKSVLLAAHLRVMALINGNTDVLTGVVLHGRPEEPDGERVLGLFLNTVPFRLELLGGRWLELLRATFATEQEMLPFRRYPLARIQQEHRGQPLVTTLFNFAHFHVYHALAGLPDVDVLDSTTFAPSHFSFTANFSLRPVDSAIQLQLEVDTRVFDVAQCAAIGAYYLRALTLMARAPEAPYLFQSLLSAQEERQVLVEWNRTQRAYAQDRCVHQLFEAQVTRTPDAVAIVFDAGSTNNQPLDGARGRRPTTNDKGSSFIVHRSSFSVHLTYRELDRRAHRVAQHLRALGIGPEALVGIVMERSPEMLIGILGVLKAGGAYVPLDPSYPAERLAFVLQDTRTTVVLTQARLVARRAIAVSRVICLDTDWPAIITADQVPAADVCVANAAYVIYTSGSTGRPKGVVVCHGNITNFFAAMDALIGGEPGVWLAVTTMSFDISVLELLWTLTRGFQVLIQAEGAAVGDLTRPDSAAAKKTIDFSLLYFASDESDGAQEKYKLLMEGAKFADQHGFSAVWTPERHFHAFGGRYPNPAITSAAVAAITRRVQIRAGSLVLPLHNPIRVVEDWSVIDNLSGGRVGISFASGWHADDFVLAPDAYADRTKIMFQAIETVRKLWKGEAIALRGGAGNTVAVAPLPRPVQTELPIWVTSAGNPETFQSAGAIGANVLTHLLGQSIAELSEKIALYRAAWREHNHGPGEGHVTLMVHTFIGADGASVREKVRAPFSNYLRSSIGLIRNLARSLNRDIDVNDFTAADMDELLSVAFDRYFETSGLFGTPETCLSLVDQLKRAGVDEIACLIDFGVDVDSVLASLEYLDTVRERANRPAATYSEGDTVPGRMLRHGVSHMQCTPSFARVLMADPQAQPALGGLQKLLLGGEALPLALATRLSEIVTGDFHNMYGPTETTIWSATWPVRPHVEKISIGRPIANTELYVLDRCLQPVPIGVAGELCIGGSGVVRGYLNRPDLTAERFVPNPFWGMGDKRSAGGGLGWGMGNESSIPHPPSPIPRLYRTGDLARHLPDGALELLGRRDDQVKIRGFRIEPGEIETVLGQHPAVCEAAVLVREDLPGDRRLVAYLVMRTEGRGLSGADSSALSPQSSVLSELRDFLRERLPEYMIPSIFSFLDALPLTPNGKIDRRALPAPAPARPDGEHAFVAPRTPAEEQLASIWTQILGIERVGIHDNFFELGGDSILSIQIIAQAKQAGLQLTARQLFDHPTIAELAPVVGALAALQPEQAPASGQAPLTPIQCWFFEQALADPHHWNQAVLLETRPGLDEALLWQAVRRVLAHHDALHLRFEPCLTGWRQFYAGVDTPFSPTVIDLSGIPEGEHMLAIETLANELQASLHVMKGPLVRAAFFALGDARPGRLLLIIHHLVIDGVSWRVLLEDVQLAYRQLRRGETIPLPAKTASFKQWAERLMEYARSARLHEDAAYWLAAPDTPTRRLPLDHPAGANTEASARTLWVSLGVEETRALLYDVPKVYRTQINDVLLTALAQAFAAWSGAQPLLIDLEGHGREEIVEGLDLSRTVGWFTSLFPVWLDLGGCATPGDALKSVKEQLRGFAHRGIGYGVMRYLSEQAEAAGKLRALPRAEVLFNYLGQADQILEAGGLFQPAPESYGSTRGPRNQRRYLLEISAIVTGGQLRVSWIYSAAIHRQATVERLVQQFVDSLSSLIQHCRSYTTGAATPADFPLAGLSQEKLDAVITKFKGKKRR